jgi:NADH-quinone oxidoreductase subunit H
VGPLGFLQLIADAIKFIMKEEFAPQKGVRFVYYAAPVMGLIPAALAVGAIPFSVPFKMEPFELFGRVWGGHYTFPIQSFEMPVGIIYILGVSSLGAYGLLMAGWGSGNKYSLMGAMRASAQMISYELALGLSIVGAVLIYGSFQLEAMIAAQEGIMKFTFMDFQVTFPLPNWGIFYQPLGALLFFVASFAESNRLPFDLPEAEGELVAGFHTEYGGFKMLIFFMGEYGHMILASSLFIIFYLGGYHIPFVSIAAIESSVAQVLASIDSATLNSLVVSLLYLVVFSIKLLFMLWVFIWVRWTLPRFRYDQLMDLGWKKMLPWAIGNTVITAVVIFVASIK